MSSSSPPEDCSFSDGHPRAGIITLTDGIVIFIVLCGNNYQIGRKPGIYFQMQRFTLLLIISLILSSFTPAAADLAEIKEVPVKHWSVSWQTKYFFSSHTSYEFGNPFPPYQVPLSRLEFPLNTLWTGAAVRRNFSRFSAELEAFRNISSNSTGVFMDSDWDDGASPQIKTIYSESSCRMEPSYIVHGAIDLKISDWLNLPAGIDLRPVVGLRWQRFSLVTHDGVQSYPAPGDTTPPLDLPGDGINFEQTYWHYFAGLRAGFALGKPFRLSRLSLNLQLDWAYVDASNEDYHLLRAGKRITCEKTSGDAWHASANLQIGLTQNLNANIGAEYVRIMTTGSHRLVNEPFGIDFSFTNGVKVWSEQTNVMMSLEYTF